MRMFRNGGPEARHWRPGTAALLLPILGLALAGCDLSLNGPAVVEEEDLEQDDLIQTGGAGIFQYLINGARSETGTAAIGQAGPGGLFTAGALLTDELVYSGTDPEMRGLSTGATSEGWQVVDELWAAGSKARFVGEAAADRMYEQVGGPQNAATDAQLLYMSIGQNFAGFANRMLGDHFCQAVVNTGPLEDHTVFYERAEKYFSDAIEAATLGETSTYTNAGYMGRAQVRMMLGDWAGAVEDAQMVDTDATIMLYLNSRNVASTNFLPLLARTEHALTVWGTPFEAWGGPDDERVEYEVLEEDGEAILVGSDGTTPLLAEARYTSGSSDIVLGSGIEMRLIEAEAALIGGDIPTAVAKINEARVEDDLAPIDAATIATTDEAWELLMKERGTALWLQGRRLPDLRRWQAAGRDVPFQVMRNGTLTNVLDGELCLPISAYERISNPNL